MSLLHEAEAGLKSQSLRQALNAFISRVHDVPALLRAVGGAESRRRRDEALSPLDGRLIAIKDNICTRSFPTTCASRFLKTYNSPFDATVVDRLRNAGAVLTGKTNLDEFGMGSHSMHSFFGPVKNTLGSGDISAGGSSGGSAVAVATSQCQAALGTDTGGSIRLPAAYTGVLGFKPSYGLVSRWGVVAYANSLDTVGVFARSVTTAKDVYDVINGFDAQDPTSLPDSSRSRIVESISKRRRGCPLCIGVPIQYNVAELNPVVKETWLRTLQRFEDDGHSVQPVSLPTTRHALSAYYVLAPAEASSNLAKYDGVRYGTRDEVDDTAGGVLYAATRGKGFGEEVKRRILLGAYSLSAEAIDNYFLQAQRVRRLVQRDFDNVFDLPNPLHARQPGNVIGGVDVLVCPTTPSLPPTLHSIKGQSPVESYTNDVLTVPASLAGLPAMSVPVSIESAQDTSTAGTAGMQLIAQYGDDDLLFDVARIMEEWKPLVSQPIDR